jgi:hypothetical protein
VGGGGGAQKWRGDSDFENRELMEILEGSSVRGPECIRLYGTKQCGIYKWTLLYDTWEILMLWSDRPCFWFSRTTPSRTGKGRQSMSRCCGCTRSSDGRRKVPCWVRLHPLGVIQTKTKMTAPIFIPFIGTLWSHNTLLFIWSLWGLFTKHLKQAVQPEK